MSVSVFSLSAKPIVDTIEETVSWRSDSLITFKIKPSLLCLFEVPLVLRF